MTLDRDIIATQFIKTDTHTVDVSADLPEGCTRYGLCWITATATVSYTFSHTVGNTMQLSQNQQLIFEPPMQFLVEDGDLTVTVGGGGDHTFLYVVLA